MDLLKEPQLMLSPVSFGLRQDTHASVRSISLISVFHIFGLTPEQVQISTFHGLCASYVQNRRLQRLLARYVASIPLSNASLQLVQGVWGSEETKPSFLAC